MVKNQNIQKNSKSSENFQNFGGGFVRIRLLATEQELFENRAKPTKSMKIEDFGLSFFELSVDILRNLRKSSILKIQAQSGQSIGTTT